MNLFRTHIVGSANIGSGILGLVREDAREAEVAEFDVVSDIEEDIARFDVSVENFAFFAVVALIQGQDDLREDLPDHIFSHEILLLLALLDQLRHVSSGTMLHYDIQFLRLLVNYPIIPINTSPS